MGRIANAIFVMSSLGLGGAAGCGAVEGPGTVDAGPDADLSGNARVTTQSTLAAPIGMVVGGIDLVSSLPDGTVLATGKTDAGGAAEIRVVPGGMVTAIYRRTVDMGAELITWAGVKPGDNLTFGSRNFSFAGAPDAGIGAMNYSWPALAGATGYSVRTSCGGSFVAAPTVTTAVAEGMNCHREPMDVFFAATSAAGAIVGYAVRQNVPFVSGGALALSNWQTPTNATVNITGIPPSVTSVSGSWSSVIDGASEVAINTFYSGVPNGGAFTQSFAFHPGADRTLGRLTLSRPGFATMRLVDQFTAFSPSQTVTAPVLPPWMQGGVLVSAALRTASWAIVSEPGAVADGVAVRAAWSRPGTPSSIFHQWHAILPPGQSSIAFPQLPAPLAEAGFSAQDNVNAAVATFEVSTLDGYDAVRAQPSRNFMCIDCALRAGEFPRAVVTGFGSVQ
jgi:hypothetical protein